MKWSDLSKVVGLESGRGGIWTTSRLASELCPWSLCTQLSIRKGTSALFWAHGELLTGPRNLWCTAPTMQWRALCVPQPGPAASSAVTLPQTGQVPLPCTPGLLSLSFPPQGIFILAGQVPHLYWPFQPPMSCLRSGMKQPLINICCRINEQNHRKSQSLSRLSD